MLDYRHIVILPCVGPNQGHLARSIINHEVANNFCFTRTNKTDNIIELASAPCRLICSPVQKEKNPIVTGKFESLG